MLEWIPLIVLMVIFVFKLGQSYERSKTKIEYKFSCLDPTCQFSIETNGMDETMKLANEHAQVHVELRKDRRGRTD